MKTIHKHVLDQDSNPVHTFEGARFLHVDNQHGHITVWAEVHTLQRETTRTLHLVPTGGPIPVATHYVGTALMAGGNLVIHVYADREQQ